MMRTIRCAVSALLVVGCFGSVVGAYQEPEKGTLRVRVMLVGSDLALKPVPKRVFAILPLSETTPTINVVTSFDGDIEQPLAAGAYRIRSEKAVELDGQRFSWDLTFEIRPGTDTVLELSNDNAHVEQVDEPAAGGVTREGAIYERYSRGVFKILAEAGHGTGFLISDDGLVLTNHHVVAESDYLSVECDAQHKYQALLLAEDSQRDLAILRLHPDAVRDLPVLELADDSLEHPSVSVGERVLAIGNPLTTETILTSGLISKVEEESIYSDVNINEGNSGGPLLDLRGRVVGVTTFGISGEQGPGVSGIVRIHRVLPLIDQAREGLVQAEPPPSRLLPVASKYRFSPDEVRDQALSGERKAGDYRFEAGKIDVQFITPALTATVIINQEREAAEGREKRKKRQSRKQAKKSKQGKQTQGEQTEQGEQGEPEPQEYQPGQAFYDWQKQAENFVPVVYVRALPEVKMKFGSAFKSALVGTGVKYGFKTDFARMELHRNGEVVEPIHPGRIKQVVHIEGAARMKDIGYFGIYQYPPEAFGPGADVTLRIWEEGQPEPFEQALDSTILQRIWNDYAPYLDWKNAESEAEP